MRDDVLVKKGENSTARQGRGWMRGSRRGRGRLLAPLIAVQEKDERFTMRKEGEKDDGVKRMRG